MQSAPAIHEIRRESLADQAYAQLRDAIVTGAFPPGERLIERELSTQTKISRTPLREAIIRLRIEGLVTDGPAGHVVASTDETAARELFAIRTALESHATRLAAESADEHLVRTAHALVARERAELDATGDPRVLEDLNTQLHTLIYRASGLPRLAELTDVYRKRALSYRIYEVYRRDEIRDRVLEHEAIVDALSRRDADAADRLMRQHIEFGTRITLERRVLDAGTSAPAA